MSNDTKTNISTENPSNNNVTNIISNPFLNGSQVTIQSRQISERKSKDDIYNFSNFKEKKILDELEEIDKLLIKEPIQKDGFLNDEDFAIKNEEMNGSNLKVKGIKIKKIRNLNFLSDLQITKK